MVSLALITLSCLAMSAFAADLQPGEFVFEWDNGQCSLEAVEAPVAEILAAVAERTGVAIVYQKDDPTTLSRSASGVDMEALMNMLGENVVVTYVSDATAPDGYRVDSVKIDPPADEGQREVGRALQEAARRAVPEPGSGGPTVAPQYMAHRSKSLRGGGEFSSDRRGVHLYADSTNSPIARAGIRPEDTIIEVNNRPVTGFQSLKDIMKEAEFKDGDEAEPIIFTIRTPEGRIARKRVLPPREED